MTPVWKHLKNGRKVAMVLKRDHKCTPKCYGQDRAFGLVFSYCKRYSYRPEGDRQCKKGQV